jgi:hypothetical protein
VRGRSTPLAIACALVLADSARAAGGDLDRFAAALEKLRSAARIPGLSAAIVQDGRVVFARGFGFANLEKRYASTVKNLIAMSTPEQHRYLSYGNRSGLEKILPGVKIDVLGPPTIKAYKEVLKATGRLRRSSPTRPRVTSRDDRKVRMRVRGPAEESEQSRYRRQRPEPQERRADRLSPLAGKLVGNEKPDAGSEERARRDDEEE